MRVTWLVFMSLVVSCGAMVGAVRRTSLDIYAIDVEGGQAILFVSPSGESLLVDSGNPGARDADRIAAAAKQAGVDRIDYLVVTHMHGDHFGGVPELMNRLPIRNFVDHGLPIFETSESAVTGFRAYAAARDKGHHLPVKAGDKIPIQGLDVRVVTAGGTAIATPLKGAGAPNTLCGDFKPKIENDAAKEDGRSVGIVIRLGRFSAIDLGDLTWNKEVNMVCPNNLLGTVDLYVTSRHGIAAGSATLVHALKPRVGLFDNGARKGASSEPFLILKSSPGLEDIWQLHYSVPRPPLALFGETTDQGGKDLNAPEQFIANIDEQHTEAQAHFLKVSAQRDGGFTVTNERTGYSKEYKPLDQAR
jgi:competence protein ComEC